MIVEKCFFVAMALVAVGLTVSPALSAPEPSLPTPAAELFPLASIRLLESPFTGAVKANREYLLALEPDRLLAPFR
ncbi:MAG: hypothetical protein H8F28_00300, partial [Fibrella sp.]|nr:hypothetical protein [Armatimonadota bacterium]